ncbi:MAG: HNH endonuclease [Thermoanaerobaculia bacterium]
MPGRAWSESELLRALALYYQIPFGAIDQRNPAIIALARELGRTPGSVGLKLANFASLDPSVVASGRIGMANSSREDRRVFATYATDWSNLADQLSPEVTLAIARRRENAARSEMTSDSAIFDALARPTEALMEIRARRGQDFFRNATLAAYGEKCCITGLPVRELLRASHIIPWKVDPQSRLDPANGLCLNALHDAAFDRGLMTLDEDHRVVFSRSLHAQIPAHLWPVWFGAFEGKPINAAERTPARRDALLYHRERLFVG